MRRKHPHAVDSCFVDVLPSGNSFEFVLDNNPPQGWSIYKFRANSEVSMLLVFTTSLYIDCIVV